MQEPPRIWKEGETLMLTYGGRTVEALVETASDNGYSLILTFQALLVAFAGTMPVRWSDRKGEYQDLILHGPAVLEPKAERQSA